MCLSQPSAETRERGRGGNRRRKEGDTYGHGQQPRLVVAHGKVLVGKGLGPVDADGAGAVAVEEVAALAHEVGDLQV